MQEINIRYYKTSIGELIMGSFHEQLCLCDWKYRKMRSAIDKRIQKELNANYFVSNSGIIQTAIIQIEEYLNKQRKNFDIPILTTGTEFQKKVWNKLNQIPYGSTVSYFDLSRKLGDIKAIRAVASANGANSISIIIPCHRVVGSNGDLTGYAGGISVKKRLLALESGWQTNLNL